MASTPKQLKQINVIAHLRKKEKGGVTQVKQHKRLEEINIESVNLEQYLRKSQEIINPTQENKKIIDLYRTGFHATKDAGVEAFLNDKLSPIGLDDGLLTDAFADFLRINELGTNEHLPYTSAIKRLTSEEYIKGLSDGVDKLQKVFEGKGRTVERLTPFTFRFKHDQKPIEYIEYTLLRQTVDHNLRTHGLSDPNVGVGWNYDMRTNFAASCDSLEDLFKLGEVNRSNMNMIQKNIVPSNIHREIWNNKENFNISEHIEPLSPTTNEIMSNLIHNSEEPNQHLFADSELVRKTVLDALKKEPVRSSLSKSIKSLRSTDVPSVVDQIAHTGTYPKFMENNEYMDGIYKAVDAFVLQPYRDTISPEAQHMYISKNPLEFLTMSPTGNFESCQSLTKGNMLHITGLNTNIMDSFLLDGNNDFIAFTIRKTADKKGVEKTARASYQYDKSKNKTVNWEGDQMYGSVRAHRNIIDEFFNNTFGSSSGDQYSDALKAKQSIPNRLKFKIEINDKLDELTKLDSAYGSQEGAADEHSGVHTKAYRNMEKIKREAKTVYKDLILDVIKQKRNIINNIVVREIKNGESLLYDSPLFHMIAYERDDPYDQEDSMWKYMDDNVISELKYLSHESIRPERND